MAIAAAAWAQDPVRIPPEVAAENLVKRVEPAVPPLAKAAGIGGTVRLDITISPEGKVVSVKALSGHPMLVPSFMQTVRQWEYKPFTVDGQRVQAVTEVQWSVAEPERTAREQRALKEYYPAFDRCYRLVQAGKGAEAERTCRNVVRLSDDLPAERILERGSARNLLAHSLVQQRKLKEAIALYEEVLAISAERRDEKDADYASNHANLARAYFLNNEPQRADPLFARAVVIYEAAIEALPSMKENYTARLKRTLLDWSRLKQALGQREEAAALEQRAATL